MSRLDELINELCPYGVVYKQLWELTAWDKKFSGVEKYKQKKIIKYNYLLASDLKKFESSNGNVKILTTSITDKWAKEEDVADILSEGEIVCIPWGGNPVVQYFNGKFITGDNRIATSLNKEILDNKFLYYWLQSNLDVISSFYRGSGIKHPDMSKVLDLYIPVPPIEVQREIVRILDTFSKQTEKLTAELSAELEMRKKQYEYYRNKIFMFNNVSVVSLSEIADIGTGSSNTNEATEDGKYPFFVRSQEPLRKNDYEFDEIAIITAGDGVGVGRVFHYIEGKYALHQRAYRIHINQSNVIPKYCFHYMKSMFPDYINSSKFHSSVSSIRRPMLNAFPVPLPPLEEQQRIVNILDKYDAIYNEITQKISAEIELRRKQYEYYRDKLLTFKELDA